MGSVFLSYAREDTSRAARVATALEKAGLSVWWDERISGGGEYSKEIERALIESDAVVVLWSRSSIDSPWVRDEAAKGRDSGKLIPATLDGTEPPLGFGQFQTTDLSRRRSSGLKQLVSVTVAKVAARSGSPEDAPSPAVGHSRNWQAIAGAAAAAVVVILMGLYVVFGNPFGSRSTANLASGKVAITSFETLSSDSGTQRLARLTTEAVERVLATNFIQTVSSEHASSSAVEDADFGLRGTIDHNADTTTASATVTDLKSGTTLWSTRIERPSREADEIPEQTAIWLADVLRCSSDFSKRMSAHRSLELLRRILRYCDAMRNGQFEQLPKLGKELVEIAPRSGDAHALEALGLAFFAGENPLGRRRAVYSAARKAIELDPKTGIARYAIAAVSAPSLSIAERERMLRRAIENDPSFGWTKQQLAAFMRKVGRFEEARRLYTQFLGEYPLDYSQRRQLAELTADAGNVQAARRHFEILHQVRPGDYPNYPISVETFMGDADAAKGWLDRMDLTDQQRLCTIRVIDAVAQKRAGGPAANLGECRTESILPVARIDVALGDLDRAYAQLDSDIADAPDPHFAWWGAYFIFQKWAAALRADPRFMPLMAKDGRAQYWLETGKWPDFCREEKLPYDCRDAAKAAVAAARR